MSKVWPLAFKYRHHIPLFISFLIDFHNRPLESEFDTGECGQSDYDSAELSHVHFNGMDDMNASIPTLKAMHREGDVLLAYRMNGDDVPPYHGYPLRAVVPGHAGVRSVKHLVKVRVEAEEASGTWQQGMAYKGFNPSVKSTQGKGIMKHFIIYLYVVISTRCL